MAAECGQGAAGRAARAASDAPAASDARAALRIDELGLLTAGRWTLHWATGSPAVRTT